MRESQITNNKLQIAIVLLVASLAGCNDTAKTNGDVPSTDGGKPIAIDYAALAKRYNGRVERAPQMWARAVVEIDWVDADGKGHFEQGDGTLMLRKPGELALSVGKLGEIMQWLGADAERFWWMDLKPAKGEPTTAYVGRNDQIKPGDAAGPLPVAPEQLIGLMGLSPIPGDEESHPEPSPAALGDGSRVWVTTPLGDAKGGGPARHTLIEVATGHAVEVAITDGEGLTVVSAKLDRYEAMEVDQAPPGAWPMVATRIEIVTPARRGRLTLFLSDVSDGKRHDRIKDQQFNFEKLVELLAVQRVKVLRPTTP